MDSQGGWHPPVETSPNAREAEERLSGAGPGQVLRARRGLKLMVEKGKSPKGRVWQESLE